jgi:RNA polymerase sigma-70 factor (ECF subfamily)
MVSPAPARTQRSRPRAAASARVQRTSLAGNATAAAGVLRLVDARPVDDAELVMRARDGDAAAYERLVERHADIAFRIAYVLTRNAADAEEAAQDAFLKAHRALGRFRAGSPWRPWLLRIVANEARNRRRSAGRRTRLELRAAETAPPVAGAPSSESIVLMAERDASLRAALATLAEPDREVLYLRYFLDLPEGEMAAVLDCRPGTVKSRLSRSLARLRAALEDADA